MPLSDLSNPEVLLKENWEAHKRVGVDGTPILPPEFVAESGPRVWVIDLRDDEALTGPQGYIPGSSRMLFGRIGEVKGLLGPTTPTVLVCGDGRRSSIGALYLTQLGMTAVAAMEGGMRQWRSEGYAVSRDPAVLTRWLQAPVPGHGADGRPLHFARPPGEKHLTKEMIVAHVGDAKLIRRVKLASLLTASQTSCVDGREDRAIIGTPGGDAGELVLGLAAVEQVTGSRVDLARIRTLTRAFADTFGGIYLHTDNHALNRLARALQADSRFEPAVAGLASVDHWESFLRRPPRELQSALLEHLINPDHVGCGHLKLALKNSDTYGVRPEIIVRMFEAFYTELWNDASDLEWVVLGGDHSEGAVVNVTLAQEVWPFSDIPMIPPSIGGMQMFVNHPQVVAYLRTQTARFLNGPAAHLLPIGPGQGDALFDAIPELGGNQATATLKMLAGGLPLFSLHFDANGGFTVDASGAIPTA